MFVWTVSRICSSVMSRYLPQAADAAFHSANRTPETPTWLGHLASIALNASFRLAWSYAAMGKASA